jgi:hypothetical protein
VGILRPYDRGRHHTCIQATCQLSCAARQSGDRKLTPLDAPPSQLVTLVIRRGRIGGVVRQGERVLPQGIDVAAVPSGAVIAQPIAAAVLRRALAGSRFPICHVGGKHTHVTARGSSVAAPNRHTQHHACKPPYHRDALSPSTSHALFRSLEGYGQRRRLIGTRSEGASHMPPPPPVLPPASSNCVRSFNPIGASCALVRLLE